MSYHPRKMLTHGESRKRKERDFPFLLNPNPTSAKPLITPTSVKASNRRTITTKEPQAQQPQQQSGTAPTRLSSNRLLAGYMAHEFLTKGTLLGKKFAEEGRPAKLKKERTDCEAEPALEPKPVAYAELSRLLLSGGAHVPDVVNPSQLAKWIQM